MKIWDLLLASAIDKRAKNSEKIMWIQDKIRRICKNCGEKITSVARVKPLKIKSKPTVKYSTAKKGKVTLNFANKYYKEKSASDLTAIYFGSNLSA